MRRVVRAWLLERVDADRDVLLPCVDVVTSPDSTAHLNALLVRPMSTALTPPSGPMTLRGVARRLCV